MDAVSSTDETPYVVVTGESRLKTIGLVTLSLAALAFLGVFFYYTGWVSMRLTIAGFVFLAVSVAWLIGRVRTEWRFDANGIFRRTQHLFSHRTRHFAVADIAAVGVETTRPSRIAKPFLIFSSWSTIADLEKEKANMVDAAPLYRLAFKLHSGEALFIDDQQPAALFTERLEQ